MSTRHAYLMLAVGALVAGLWFGLTGGDSGDARADSQASSAAQARTGLAADEHRSGQTSTAPTTIDEAARLLELGASGDLTVDMNTRGALDVLLASLGPDASQADFARLEEALRRSMPGEAATQAIALVRRYDAYARAAGQATNEQATPPSTPDELQRLHDKTLALRREHFDDATARALFGAEEDLTKLDMAMNAIQADASLTPERKAAQIAALRERLPRDLPGLSTTAASGGDLDAQVAALRQQGGTPAQIEQVRSRQLGDEAARAMTEMEAQRAQWESRYQAYAAQKKGIVAAAAPDMATQLDLALRAHFKDDELDAARAYDRHQAP